MFSTFQSYTEKTYCSSNWITKILNFYYFFSANVYLFFSIKYSIQSSKTDIFRNFFCSHAFQNQPKLDRKVCRTDEITKLKTSKQKERIIKSSIHFLISMKKLRLSILQMKLDFILALQISGETFYNRILGFNNTIDDFGSLNTTSHTREKRTIHSLHWSQRHIYMYMYMYSKLSETIPE